jgi:hypothetical protein
MPLKLRSINAKSAPEAVGGYSQALETTNSNRRLYISGQIPMTRSGALPESFGEQAELVWANIFAQLEAADMTLGQGRIDHAHPEDLSVCIASSANHRAQPFLHVAPEPVLAS